MKAGASFGEAMRVAVASLRSSKLRSFLTLLGIILATTTLIAVVSVINGMDLYIANQLSTMGVNGFRVVRLAMIGNFDAKKYLELIRRNPQLTVEEYNFVKSRATLLSQVGMVANRSAPVRYGTNLVEGAQLMGVTSNVGIITNVTTSMGRFLTDTEDERRVSVAFIGEDIRQRFFEGLDPIGKSIAIEGRPFVVVGVAKAKGRYSGSREITSFGSRCRPISRCTAPAGASRLPRRRSTGLTTSRPRTKSGCCFGPIAGCGPTRRTPSRFSVRIPSSICGTR